MFSLQSKEISRAQELLSGYVTPEIAKQALAPITFADDVGDIFASIRKLPVYAGINLTQVRQIRARLIAGIIIIVGCTFLLRFPQLILAVPVLFLLEWFQLKRKAYARAESFERDYTALLLSLSSSVRTGLDPMVALAQARELFSADAEVRREIERLNDGLEHGKTEDQVITDFAQTIDHPDVRLFRTAMILARREGSSLSECLRRLARVTRQRQSFRRKIRAAVAMQKLSAFGIGVCAILIGTMQFVANPDVMHDAMQHPVGSKALFGAITLIFIGIFWMLRLARARI